LLPPPSLNTDTPQFSRAFPMFLYTHANTRRSCSV
jgi:hypothetical protein